MRISANLGFLFRSHTLPDAIREAARHGFDAVECHWPYKLDPSVIAGVLAETGLPMVSLNTRLGNSEAGELGLAAVPGRSREARAHIEEAIRYAAAIGCGHIHVMAGRAEGREAFSTFVASLEVAAASAAPHGIGLLIEPLNTRDAPGYFLATLAAAREVVEAVGAPNLKIMFDCYHMQIMGGDLLTRAREALPLIGHVQFAGVPDRGEPDCGEVAYARLLPALAELGYDGFFGAEYRPITGGFDWLRTLRGQPGGS